MPHASHRMDLLVVPCDLEQGLDEEAVSRLFSAWGLDAQGRSLESDRFVEGGCARIWVDRPGRLWLYGNQSGGFRVVCPVNGQSISKRFGQAHRDWKAGGPRTLECLCGETHALEDCVGRPPMAFAQWALVFSAVGGSRLTERASRDAFRAFGEHAVVLRRP